VGFNGVLTLNPLGEICPLLNLFLTPLFSLFLLLFPNLLGMVFFGKEKGKEIIFLSFPFLAKRLKFLFP
jgi:hypothetical protein